ncbi:hypothetical protein [Paenibacillus sp. LjRoot56]|uniref:hypothetical protein n=1 Tax=Paenibacillus sp. LjRoot56 TaxID=3342333 RepID=UPI003ECE37AD
MILRLSPYTWKGDAELEDLEGMTMVRIQFQSIHIDDITENSSVNKGSNRISGRRHSAKTNQGIGELTGDHNVVLGGKHTVLDNDTFDVKPNTRKS